MLDQFTSVEAEFDASDRGVEQMGYGACNRCISEACPNPCHAFVGTGSEPSTHTPCQRNWCGHSFSDHS